MLWLTKKHSNLPAPAPGSFKTNITVKRPPSKLTGHGISASVLVNGKALPVYGAETSGTTTRAFIEATDGATFEVHVDCSEYPGGENIFFSSELYLDGKRADGRLDMGFVPFVHKNRLEGRNRRYAFVFEPLKLTNDPVQACEDRTFLDELGTITVYLNRFLSCDDSKLPSAATSAASAAASFDGCGGDSVNVLAGSPEAALSHYVSYEAAKKGDPAAFFEGEPFDWAPFATFSFRYRSHAILENAGLILGSDTAIVNDKMTLNDKLAIDNDTESVAPSCTSKRSSFSFFSSGNANKSKSSTNVGGGGFFSGFCVGAKGFEEELGSQNQMAEKV